MTLKCIPFDSIYVYLAIKIPTQSGRFIQKHVLIVVVVAAAAAVVVVVVVVVVNIVVEVRFRDLVM